ncbi:MAG: putative alpha/beta hydrolase [Pseudonocardiales bacterium]
MTFSQADLVARAGIDPWGLRDQLTEGNPAQIETLAATFYSASGDMEDSNAAQRQAQIYVSQGYTVNGSSPVDFEAEVRATKQTPEHLNEIAKILTTVAGDLDTKTRTAKTQVGDLESTLTGINSDWTTFLQTMGRGLPPEDREAQRQVYLGRAVEAVKTTGSQVNTVVTDYEVALMSHLKRLGDLGYVPSSNLQEGPDPLDLPLTNLEGEQIGGIHPDLPTDLASLQRLLDAARATGVDPSRYAALLQQYWLVKAANDAGIDLNAWDPQAGVDGNMANIANVYEYYGKLFLDHPELQWAGMANMIGPSFAGGFLDLDGMEDFARSLSEKIDSLPKEVRDRLPAELKGLAAAGNLGADELRWFENKFLAMQKHIFIDQGGMHAAYLDGGAGAIDEMRRAGLIDDRAQNAWNDIASGDPARIEHGNADLLYREQNQIIAKQYDQMYQHHGPVGPVMTYGMTVAGDASVPGTRTPGEYSPLTVGGEVTVPGPIPFTEVTVGAELETPLPDFNVTDRDARWDYVTHDTLPAYQRLLREDSEQARQIISSPVEERISEQRLANRWPRLAEDMLTNWDLDVDADIGLRWP